MIIHLTYIITFFVSCHLFHLYFSSTREGLQVIQGAIMTVIGKRKWKQVMDEYKGDMEANEYGRNGGDPNKYIKGKQKSNQKK